MESQLQILGLRAFADNYIWVLRQGGNAVAVDPGDAAPVLEYLRTSADRLSAILITHHHRDHTGGVGELAARFDVPVFGPRDEDIPDATMRLTGGEKIEVPGIGMHFDVLDVGGHTCGHVAYYGSKVLLCGDALFVLGCGRLFEGTPAQMDASLSRIAALPGDTLVYCAHEYAARNIRFALAVEPDNPALRRRVALLNEAIAAERPTVPMRLADELETNPFLRCDSPEVAAAASRFRGRPLADRSEIFAALREWRNRL